MPSEIVLSIPRTAASAGTPLNEPEESRGAVEVLHAAASAAEIADGLRRAGEFGIAPVETVGRDGRPHTVFINRDYVVTIADLASGESPATRSVEFHPSHRA